MMNAEINFLIAHAQEDPDKTTRQQTTDAIDFLSQINSNHHHYEVIRINAFIPPKIIADPRPGYNDFFHGDNREFDKNALSSRTSQEFIIDLNTQQVKVVNYVGETIEYDKNGKVIKTDRASTSGMKYSKDSSKDAIHLHAFEDVGNPLGDIRDGGTMADLGFILAKAPPIEYDIEFSIPTNGSSIKYEGYTKRFPAYEVYARKDNQQFSTLEQFYPNLKSWPNAALQLYKFWGGINNFSLVVHFY